MIADVKSGQCDIGVLPFACEDPAVADIPYVREQLSVGVPYHHALAEYDTLTFAQTKYGEEQNENVKIVSQNSKYTRTGFLCIHGLKLYPNGSIMIYMSIIGNYIKEERKRAGLTQEEFAMRSGLGLRFVRELEQGKETVRLDKVNQALAMFGKEAIPGNKEEV